MVNSHFVTDLLSLKPHGVEDEFVEKKNVHMEGQAAHWKQREVGRKAAMGQMREYGLGGRALGPRSLENEVAWMFVLNTGPHSCMVAVHGEFFCLL
jgi:hypothetical protein